MFPLRREFKNGVILLVYIFAIITLTVGVLHKYTKEERIALDKFRPMVIDVLTKDFQEVDSYLIRWLWAKDLNVNAAKQMLLKALKWRKDNKIDNILEEPSLFDGTGFPDSLDGVDKDGRPVLTYGVDKMDFRRILLGGKRKKLLRAHIQLWEKMEVKAQESSNRTGTEISEVLSISDMHGFTSTQHLCIPCIAFTQEIVITSENYYAGQHKAVIIINAPRVYEFLIKRTESLQSARTKRITKIFGSNRTEWSAFVDKFVDRDQRSFQFGGTKGA